MLLTVYPKLGMRVSEADVHFNIVGISALSIRQQPKTCGLQGKFEDDSWCFQQRLNIQLIGYLFICVIQFYTATWFRAFLKKLYFI